MAVNVPGGKRQETPSTAAWPPKRMESPSVASRAGALRSADAAWPERAFSDFAEAKILSPIQNRYVHFLRRDFPCQLRYRPRHLRINLDTECVHRLHCLVILRAECHHPLRGLKRHAFHGFQQGFRIRDTVGLLERGYDCHRCRHAAAGEKIGWLVK